MKKLSPPKNTPLVGIIMGSKSDLATMQGAADVLKELGVPFEMKVISAHRTPDLTVQYTGSAKQRGIEVLIAGAGGAAHLPGVMASLTLLPVIGVPVETRALHGLDSLLSIVQMPAGIPVATMAIGNSKNAGLFAAHILAIKYPELVAKLKAYRDKAARDIKKIRL